MAEVGVCMSRPVWNQLLSWKPQLRSALSPAASWLVLRQLCTARHTPMSMPGIYRGTASRGRDNRAHTWESAHRDVLGSPLPSSSHLQVMQHLHTSTSLPASLLPRQASDNSRRAKVEAKRPMKGVSHHARAGKFRAGRQTFPSAVCIMFTLAHCSCQQSAAFLSRLPRGVKLLNGDIFPESTVKDIWYITGKDNPLITGNIAQISGREHQGGSSGQL